MRVATLAALAFLAVAALSATPAFAQNCGGQWGSSAVPGTMTAPAQPCPQERARPTTRKRDDPPGTFRAGNTTVTVGGSVSTQMGFGSRGAR